MISQYKKNPSEELKEKIKETIRNQIEIDYKDGAKDGIIKIKHEGPPPQEHSLFTIKTRSRGIGALPTLEMAQTTYMVWIKYRKMACNTTKCISKIVRG